MRRLKACEGEAGYYHCVSRVVDRRFVLGEVEKEHFVGLMRAYEEFCGLEVVTFCVMSNHFHILVRVPPRPAPEDLPTDEELVGMVAKVRSGCGAGTLCQDLRRFREAGQDNAAEELRERYFCRMWDVSWFMKVLKQRFSQWYNGRNERCGTLWEERFRSVLVEGEGGQALLTMAAYIDLNPVRAGMVGDPASYRWSGYAEAMAGSGRARAGLRLAVRALAGEVEIGLEEALAGYRCHLYVQGEVAPGDGGVRRGLAREAVVAVLGREGRVELAVALRCRVRAFCDGVVLGSRAFVERVFEARRDGFGSRRESGARGVAGGRAGDLWALRELR